MKSNQLRIFVSSTFVDLQHIREEVLKFLGVLKSDLISMEIFGSDEQGSKAVCLDNVEQCNFFIGIYAERYGTIDPEAGLSLTELEYHSAYIKLQNGTLKGLLLYVLDPNASWPIKNVDRDPVAIEKMRSFKTIIGQRHTLTYFKDSRELPFNILRDTIRKLELSVEETYKPRTFQALPKLSKFGKPIGMGFFSHELAPLFYGRSTEIRELSTQLIQYRFSLLIGVSGIGKTSLLNAGVIPEVEKMGWLIATARPLNDPLNNLRRSIWNQLIDATLPAAFGLEDVIRTVLTVNSSKKVLIIIDQFDDILNEKDDQEINKIIQALNQLYQIHHPDLHLLISYRGDLESEIGMIWQKISGAADGLPRYYLSPLGEDSSKEILLQSFSNLEVTLQDQDLLQQISNDILLESRNNGHLGVFPPFIQMVISTIYAHSTGNSFNNTAYREIGGSKEMISNYLYSQLSYLGSEREKGIQFLTALVSNYGTKTQKTVPQISEEIELSELDLQPILAKLLDLRLIHPLESGYEITHDLLARTILNGLMTDEEKDIRRFKYLLESKAQAFGSTSSILSYAEHLHIYKYRKRISCNELELKLLAASSREHHLPFAYWLDIENLKTVGEEDLIHIEATIGALKRLNAAYSPSIDNYEFVDQDYPPQSDLKKLSLSNTEVAMGNFFEKGFLTLEQDHGYHISDRAKYKSMLAIVAIAKFGTRKDLASLEQKLMSEQIEPKQKYILLRSLICLSRRLQLPVKFSLLYGYNGKHWRSVLKDLIPDLSRRVKLKSIFNQIRMNESHTTYLDYLVELLSKIIQPEDHKKVLAFIIERTVTHSREKLYDKYLILAFELGADFHYFTELIKNAVNAFNLRYTTLLHQRIAELARPEDLLMVSKFMKSMLELKQKNLYCDPTGGLVKRRDNQYLYAWVMGCAFARLATTEQMPMLSQLLHDNYYTIRKAVFDRLILLANEADFKLLLQKPPESKTYDEYASLLFVLDCKIYLLPNFNKTWSHHKRPIDHPINYRMIDLLPKLAGDPIDPEKPGSLVENYDPDRIRQFSDFADQLQVD